MPLTNVSFMQTASDGFWFMTVNIMFKRIYGSRAETVSLITFFTFWKSAGS